MHKAKLMKFLIIISLALSFLAFNEGRICPDIQISSNITKVKDDMVKNGVTIQKWTELSSTPIIIGSSKQIDYIYVTIDRHIEESMNVKKKFKISFRRYF